MLRNAIRELQRGRQTPRHVPHGRLIFHRPLSHGFIRSSLASQVAIESTHDERPIEFRKHKNINQTLAPQRGHRWRTASRKHRSTHKHHSSEFSEQPNNWNIHLGDGRSVRLSRRRMQQFKTANNDRERSFVQRVAPLFDQHDDSSSQFSRIGWARIQPEFSKSWRNQSPNILLKKILEPRHDVQFWRRQVAIARSERLPIVLLQLLIRREESKLQGPKLLLRLLPTPQEWQEILSIAVRNGHTLEDLEHYLYILQGKTDDERCKRFLEKSSPTPNFIFNFLVRQSSTITKVTMLSSLIECCGKLCRNTIEIDSRNSSLEKNGQTSAGVGSITPPEFIQTLKLLAYHCQCLEPRLILKLADIAVEYVRNMATLLIAPEKTYQAQCAVFNDALKLLQPQLRARPVQRSSPDSFFWEAQRKLLAMSAAMERPLLVDRGGFQAIRRVLSSLPKNQTEIHSSLRHVSTWPPYLQPSDGIDEVADPEDSWSRSVRAGVLMQEAGFSKEERDDALDILLGMATDGTPTIQQRTMMAQERSLSIWEASIRATRNAHEAWGRFRNPPRAGLKPGLAQYAAMFEKLVLREADLHTRDLPGDKALNFPTQQESNLTEFERARLQPPSVAQLYEQMHRDGIRPRDNCLRILVANAQSLETAHRYLNDTDEDPKAIRVLFQDDPDPQSLRMVDISLFAAYVQALTHKNKRVAKNMMRAIRMARSRVGLERSPLAQLIWGSILKNLSQHHGALKISLGQQFKLLFHAIEQMSGRDGIPLSAFIQFSKCIRKAVRWELSQLSTDLVSNELATVRNPLLRLYEDSRRDREEAEQLEETAGGLANPVERGPETQSPISLFKMGATRMKELYHALKMQEHQSQRLFGGHQVAVLDRMMWRKDTVRSDHALEYMLSLAYVGEFEEMVTVLRGLIEEWGQPDVVGALLEFEEPPAYTDFFEVLCAFRLLAEPMLEPSVVESLQEAIDLTGLNWAWPDGEAMKTYVEMQDDESISTLARVLEWIRKRRCEEVEGSWERVLGGDLV